ncbi:MAG: hypothetical protein ACYDAR_04055 [Thermomicrobiales bacterium]
MRAIRQIRTTARKAAVSLAAVAFLTACAGVGEARQEQPSIAASTPTGGNVITPLLLSPSPVPSPPSQTSPLLTPTNIPHLPSCGIIDEQNSMIVDHAGAVRAEACFWQAYQQCPAGGTTDLTIRDTLPVPTTQTGTVGAHLHHEMFALTDHAGVCAIGVVIGESNEASNTQGTPIAASGAYSYFLECSTLSRDASGRLRVSGCRGTGGSEPDRDLPAI